MQNFLIKWQNLYQDVPEGQIHGCPSWHKGRVSHSCCVFITSSFWHIAVPLDRINMPVSGKFVNDLPKHIFIQKQIWNTVTQHRICAYTGLSLHSHKDIKAHKHLSFKVFRSSTIAKNICRMANDNNSYYFCLYFSVKCWNDLEQANFILKM